MSRDQVIGALILVASVIGIIVYGWILFFTEWTILLLQLTGFVAVATILGILAWIGYTLATTPPPKPIEEIEKELEEELKKLEEEVKEPSKEVGGEKKG
ncbi:MAG TPA: transcriptional regulator [Nitrososphaeria archaeon]|nr:transcriptional regulator [Nitrososphaeria archaeon]